MTTERPMATPRRVRRTTLRVITHATPHAKHRYEHRLALLIDQMDRERHAFFWGVMTGFCTAFIIAIVLR